MESIQGCIASRGIAIGPVYLYRKDKQTFEQRILQCSDIVMEKTKIRQAIHTYKLKLSQCRVLDPTQQSIIQVQLAILEDPYFLESIFERIEEYHCNCEWALMETISWMMNDMKKIDNPYMRERALDFQDIGESLICYLSGYTNNKLLSLSLPSIIVSDELSPSDTFHMETKMILGFVRTYGSKTDHTSIIAQTMGVPALVGAADITNHVQDGEWIILDAIQGKAILHPDQQTILSYKNMQKEREKRISMLDKTHYQKAITIDNHPFSVCCNIGGLEDLKEALDLGADGVGLFRTEFLYMNRDDLPDEEEQYQVYHQAAKMLGSKPLTIRTLDVGGDKSLPYLPLAMGNNPNLGLRGIRFSLEHESIFNVQLRAILRASECGNLRILIPMITSVEEIIEVKKILDRIKNGLSQEGYAFNNKIELGIMIETPASVMIAEDLITYVDFFSVGTNDLTQYMLSVDRNNSHIQYLFKPCHPAVLRSIQKVIQVSHQAGKKTSMCGGFTIGKKGIALLIGLGLDELSVAGPDIPEIKYLTHKVNYKSAQDYAKKLVASSFILDIEKMNGL